MNEIKTVLEHAEQHCKASGARLTPKRRGILKELLKSGKALSAYELTDLFNKESKESIPTMSVRTLFLPLP